MRLVQVGDSWYLRKDVKKGKVWRDENVICFGRDKPGSGDSAWEMDE